MIFSHNCATSQLCPSASRVKILCLAAVSSARLSNRDFCWGDPCIPELLGAMEEIWEKMGRGSWQEKSIRLVKWSYLWIWRICFGSHKPLTLIIAFAFAEALVSTKGKEQSGPWLCSSDLASRGDTASYSLGNTVTVFCLIPPLPRIFPWILVS